MPCRFASSGTVATSRSASRAILALNAASNFLHDLVISVLHRLRQSRTLHTLTFGPISGVHFIVRLPLRGPMAQIMRMQHLFLGTDIAAIYQIRETRYRQTIDDLTVAQLSSRSLDEL